MVEVSRGGSRHDEPRDYALLRPAGRRGRAVGHPARQADVFCGAVERDGRHEEVGYRDRLGRRPLLAMAHAIEASQAEPRLSRQKASAGADAEFTAADRIERAALILLGIGLAALGLALLGGAA